jgi:threonine/homoserine/homoserine lactone efflux protein
MASVEITAFLVFAVVAAITPGPSNVMLTAAGANAGVRRGLPCLFGVSIGMGLMLFLVPLGLGSVVLRHALALTVLRWAGAAVLLWLAWKIATSRGMTAATDGPPVGFVAAAAFQWVNPKSWLVSASVAATFLRPDAGGAIAQAATLGGLFALAALPSGFVWLAFGATLQRMLREPCRLCIFNVAMGVLLALSIVLVVR